MILLSMSKLSEKKIYSIIKPCGLGPKKSKAIKMLSKILVKDYGGEVPEDMLIRKSSRSWA